METPSEIAQGQVFAGKFRIERVLGRGGMGIVVAAHHLVLDELVALKFLLPEALEQGEAVARFEREARAAVRIKSEHVARVTDVGRLESGAPYMVMELLRGKDLGALLRDGGPLPVQEVADYVLQAGEAIAEAHALGIIHRDLKPSNLFLTHRADGSPCIKVLDFGISKLTGSALTADHGMTRSATVMGSPLYMSPEQLLSARDVDARTDVWALGVICYELLAGRPPFEAETMPQLCMAIAHAPAAPLNERRPDVPEGLVRVVSRCLAKDPQQRVASVAELARALVAFAPTESRLSADRIDRMSRSGNLATTELAVEEPAADRASAPQFRATETVDGFGRTKPGPPSKRKHLAVAALALLTVASATIATATRCQDTSPETAAAPSAPASNPPSPAVAAPARAPSVIPSHEAPVALPVPLPESTSSASAPRSVPSTRPSRPVQRASTTQAKNASEPSARRPSSSANPVASSPPPGHGSLGGRL